MNNQLIEELPALTKNAFNIFKAVLKMHSIMFKSFIESIILSLKDTIKVDQQFKVKK
jgi:hypothetical protein